MSWADDVAPTEAYVRYDNGRYLDGWYQRLRDAYLATMADLGVDADLSPEDFLAAMDGYKARDPELGIVITAIKATVKGGLGKLRERPRGEGWRPGERWRALERPTWRPDIRAAVISRTRITLHRTIVKHAAFTGQYPIAVLSDCNALRLGEDAAERQLDYVMLADIFPTGYHATEMAGVKPGDQTVVFGAGPVGLMAAYSAILKGAGRVWVADHHPDRLRLAEEIGAIPINTNDQDPSEVVKEATLGLGADNGCECVGYQAHDPQGHEDAALTMNQLIDTVRFTGALGVVGVFLPEDPGGAEAQGELEAQGKVPIDFGMMWFKGQKVGTGQAPVKRYNRALRDLIAGGKAEPSFLVSHELNLDEAAAAYDHFDARDDGWTKVVLHPNGAS
ncbi:zinc-binding dehydrogenase [Streptomyces microflavus]|uniref:zinc-binding dehydrogenase n=1 Tax=Streptomyces microflavus TaxID=1919 RepID=UPI00332F87D3